MQKRPVVKSAPRPRDKAPDADAKHRKAKENHHPERPEDDGDRGFVLIGYGVQSGQRRVGIMLQDQRRGLGNLDRMIDTLFLAVRNAEQDQRRAPGMALVMSLHRHDLGRLESRRSAPAM